MKGKERCKILKEIRQKIADENDIPFVTSECKHQGECKGTCPKCEAELVYLEKEISRRNALGKAVAVVGISAGLCSTLTACEPVEAMKAIISNIQNPGGNDIEGGLIELEGDVEYKPQDEVDGVMVDPATLEGEVELDGN